MLDSQQQNPQDDSISTDWSYVSVCTMRMAVADPSVTYGSAREWTMLFCLLGWTPLDRKSSIQVTEHW